MEDLQDWEMLQSSDTDSIDSSLPAEGIEDDSPKSLIRSDYFALDSNSNIGSVDTRSPQPQLSDSPAEVVISPQIIESQGKDEDDSRRVDLTGIEDENNDFRATEGGVLEESKDFGEAAVLEESKDGSFGRLGESQASETHVSVENLLGSGVSEMADSEGELGSGNFEETEGADPSAEAGEVDGGGEAIVHQLESGVEEKREISWWKLPFELMRLCVSRVNPVWTFSIAAAAIGFVILKKRLSRMKQKSRSIPIKLTVEDKKVSQFMVRAARLNEAFSVVRRVPIIRPLLPSGGVTPWPALNLR